MVTGTVVSFMNACTAGKRFQFFITFSNNFVSLKSKLDFLKLSTELNRSTYIYIYFILCNLQVYFTMTVREMAPVGIEIRRCYNIINFASKHEELLHILCLSPMPYIKKVLRTCVQIKINRYLKPSV